MCIRDSLYEACGWRFVSRGGLVNVFCAPEGSGAPEFYSDPRPVSYTHLDVYKRQRLTRCPDRLSPLQIGM